MKAAESESPEPGRDESAARVPARVWHGTSLQIGGRLWGSACAFASLFLLARALPGAEFGRLTFYLALFGLVDCWTDFGTSTAVIQRSAHDPGALGPALAAGRRLRSGTAAAGLLAIASVAWLYREPGAGWIALAALYPFTRVPELSAVVYRNALDWRVPVATRALAAALRLGLVIALCLGGVEEAAVYVFAHAAGLAAGNVLLHLLARPRLPRTVQAPSSPGPPVRGLLRSAWPLGVTAFLHQSYFYVDNQFVRELRGEVELSHYNAAVRVSSLFLVLGAYATAAALPWLTRRWHAGDLGEAAARLGQGLFAAAGLLVGLALPWSARILVALFGAPFADAAGSLEWLLLAALAVHAGAVLLTSVLASGATRTVLLIAGSALVVNLAGNAWLVPLLGAEGAARATLATEVWIALASALALDRRGVRLSHRAWAWAGGGVLLAAGLLVSRTVLSFVS